MAVASEAMAVCCHLGRAAALGLEDSVRWRCATAACCIIVEGVDDLDAAAAPFCECCSLDEPLSEDAAEGAES